MKIWAEIWNLWRKKTKCSGPNNTWWLINIKQKELNDLHFPWSLNIDHLHIMSDSSPKTRRMLKNSPRQCSLGWVKFQVENTKLCLVWVQDRTMLKIYFSNERFKTCSSSQTNRSEAENLGFPPISTSCPPRAPPRHQVRCLTGWVLILQINTNATAKKAERRLKCHWITSAQPKH